jgi:hypothetical protein
MSTNPFLLAASAAAIVTAMGAPANAGCGGCEVIGPAVMAAPVVEPVTVMQPVQAYQPVTVMQPVEVYQPVQVMQPVAPIAQIAVAPAATVVSGWDTGNCGCGRSAGFAASGPLFVVNQGPDYSGPGIQIPYGSVDVAGYTGPGAYPYVSSPLYGPGYGPGFGYGAGYGYRYGAARWHGYARARYAYHGGYGYHGGYAYRGHWHR